MRNTAKKFWSRIKKLDSGCWEWQGSKTSKGYGHTTWNGQYISTHRLAYILTHGGIPEGKIVCHSCDYRPCCNPDHLWAGTYSENTLDRDRKGRRRIPDIKGEKHAGAKLTDANVRYIRELYSTGRYTYKAIAECYRVHKETIRSICIRETWSHI